VHEYSFDFNRVFWYNKWYTFGKEKSVVSITASEARKNLFPLIEQVNENREPIEITSKRGDAVLMSRADFDALNETALLLRSRVMRESCV
jgi:prevent-host-death family protein